MQRIIYIISIIFLFISMGYSKMNQKIAVLEFTVKGKNEKYKFLSQSIPQNIEIQLDKTEKIYVIRKYLWQEVYPLKTAIINEKQALEFGLKANLDGVIFGHIVFQKNQVVVIINIFSTAENKTIYQEEYNLTLNQNLFNKNDEALKRLAKKIIEFFPQKDPEVIYKEKKKTKHVYTDIQKINHQLKATLGYHYLFVNAQTPYLEPETTNIMDFLETASAHGMFSELAYRYNIIETGIKYSFALSGNNKNAQEISFQIGLWLFRDIFYFYPGISYFQFKSTKIVSHALYYFIGIKIKPTENFNFGMAVGPAIKGDIKSDFDFSGWKKTEQSGMYFSFNYEIYPTSKLGIIIKIGSQENYQRYEKQDSFNNGKMERSIEVRPNFLNLGVLYKL